MQSTEGLQNQYKTKDEELILTKKDIDALFDSTERQMTRRVNKLKYKSSINELVTSTILVDQSKSILTGRKHGNLPEMYNHKDIIKIGLIYLILKDL